MNDGAYSGTQAIQRAVAVLHAFGPQPELLTPAEISRRAGLNRSTVYRMLSALEQHGLVVGQDGRYRLGPELIALGNLALRQIDLRALALLELRELAHQSGETVDLEILRGGEVLIIEEVTGEYLLATSGNIGRTYPAARASTGKALLALLPPAALAELLAGPLAAQADATALQAELAQVRAAGYATSYEELEPHLHAIGAAIRDHTGQAVAAISISGPAARLPRSREAELATLICAACARLSAALGHRTA